MIQIVSQKSVLPFYQSTPTGLCPKMCHVIRYVICLGGCHDCTGWLNVKIISPEGWGWSQRFSSSKGEITFHHQLEPDVNHALASFIFLWGWNPACLSWLQYYSTFGHIAATMQWTIKARDPMRLGKIV